MGSIEMGMAKLGEIHHVMAQIARDGSKFFDKGNKAAGVRARKSLQDLKQLAQDLRIAIQRCKTENAQARLIHHDDPPANELHHKMDPLQPHSKEEPTELPSHSHDSHTQQPQQHYQQQHQHQHQPQQQHHHHHRESHPHHHPHQYAQHHPYAHAQIPGHAQHGPGHAQHGPGHAQHGHGHAQHGHGHAQHGHGHAQHGHGHGQHGHGQHGHGQHGHGQHGHGQHGHGQQGHGQQGHGQQGHGHGPGPGHDALGGTGYSMGMSMGMNNSLGMSMGMPLGMRDEGGAHTGDPADMAESRGWGHAVGSATPMVGNMNVAVGDMSHLAMGSIADPVGSGADALAAMGPDASDVFGTHADSHLSVAPRQA